MMQEEIKVDSAKQVKTAVERLDLDSVVSRMMDKETGLNWKVQRVEAASHDYRLFLSLIAKYPEKVESLVISKDVDAFWHMHILDTRKYAMDCDMLFGYFLHHNPHIGTRTGVDIACKTKAIQQTQQLYQKYVDELGSVENNQQAAWCNAAISSQKAAWCNASLSAEQVAWCNAAIDEKKRCLVQRIDRRKASCLVQRSYGRKEDCLV